jgi:cytochrome c oxidase assembly protein subunit 15
LVAVYFLIVVGSVVRTTGSGMGCPDWPKCFGSYIPPTSVDQLPTDYKENYSAFRDKKNKKFAKYLRMIGMNETADRITNDQSILAESDFNATKTWIEYGNRLVGVVIGILVVALFVRSFKFRKTKPVLFWLSVLNLIVLIFQGWFGSIVVSTNLTHWTITVHMLLALVIAGLLIYLVHKSGAAPSVETNTGSKWLLLFCMAVLLIQVFLGTEVRGSIDTFMNSLPRESWIKQLGLDFILHRSFSWVVLLANAVFFFQIRKTIELKALSGAMFLLILCSLATGVIMAYFNIPAVFQPLHLLFATACFGLQLMLFFRMDSSHLKSI